MPDIQMNTVDAHRRPASDNVIRAFDDDDLPPPPYSKEDTTGFVVREHNLPSYVPDVATSSEIRSDQHQPTDPLNPNGPINYARPPEQRRRRDKRRFCWIPCIVAMIIVSAVAGVVSSKVRKAEEAGTNDQDNPEVLGRQATHRLTAQFQGDSFFDNFDFYTDSGNETYSSRLVDVTFARENGLIAIQANKTATIRIQNNSTIRLVSKRTFSDGYFVFDMGEVPQSCRYVSSIRFASSASPTPETEVIIYEQQGRSAYTQRGYRIPSTNECNATFSALSDQEKKHSYTDCYAKNATNPPAACMYQYTAPNYRASNFLITNIDTKNSSIYTYNSMNVVFGYYLRQINAGYINMYPWLASVTMAINPACDIATKFQDLRLIIDVNVCGDYGTKFWEFTPGTWCERICAVPDPPSFQPRDAWNFNRILAFERV